MTPVILGAIEMRRRTTLRGLQACLASLRWHHPTIRVVLFNRSLEHEALATILRRYDVESVDALAFEAAHHIPFVEIEIARFLAYRAWLAHQAVSGVVMIDVLDTVWQDDPVRVLPETTLQVAAEHKRLGECPYNSKWMRQTFPAEHAAWLAHPIYCCGVIAGARAPVCRYLDFYAEEFACRGGSVRRGFDSAILNGYLAQTTGEVLTLPFENPVVMHLGYAEPAQVSYEDKVRYDAIAPVLVHQYNRHADVTQKVYERWS